ncbi:MAG: cyclic pyranopterin monophosphate synthase MoaC [Spartobacteria bacterium]
MSSPETKPQADWSHLDEGNNPAMVDVSTKAFSRRTATALAEMWLPPEVASRLIDGEIQAPKGPVFHTAIIAGTMAAKNTSNLIPFCHPLPLEGIKISITPRDGGLLEITAEAKVTYKPGVDMEALTAATVAALTVYDMCKVFSHAMEIRNVRLVEKQGGKSDYQTNA